MHRVAARPGHLVVLVGLVGILLAPTKSASATQEGAPSGQMIWAVHTTLVPAWLDPADNIQQTPFAFLHGWGPPVEESGLGLLGGYGFSGPYEDVKLNSR